MTSVSTTERVRIALKRWYRLADGERRLALAVGEVPFDGERDAIGERNMLRALRLNIDERGVYVNARWRMVKRLGWAP